jgi:hypothetical protein
VNWGVFPSAVRVLGKDNFDDGSLPVGGALKELNFPVGSPGVTSDGTLVIAELGATQLKVFDQYMAADGQEAAFTFTVDNGIPSGASVHGRRLVVLEDSMVAIYDDVPGAPPSSAPDATAGGAEGCSASQLNRPRSAHITPLGQLVVADTDNNRVLIWNEIPAAGGDALGNASVVVGQVFKDKCAPNDFNGDGTSEGTPRAETLNRPTSVWSDGVKLIVADRNNHRVLIWDTFPTDDFEAPDHVLGQADFISGDPNAGLASPTASTLADPMSVDVSESGQIAVVDRSNHRVLVWNAFPSARTAPADQVIGQPGPLAGAESPASIRTLDAPSGVRFDGRNMIVTDTGNNRVLVFRALD